MLFDKQKQREETEWHIKTLLKPPADRGDSRDEVLIWLILAVALRRA